MNIQQNINLSNYSTMRVGTTAKYFTEVESSDEIKEAIQFANEKGLDIQIIGDGSNLFFLHDFDGLVIKNKIKDKEIIEETSDYVILKVGAGENWHDLVEYTVENNWAGMENLAYIPGTVGAAPVQNIAAYGQVQEDTFEKLEAIELSSGSKKEFSKNEMEFDYRSSVMKKELKNKYIITHVYYKFKKFEKFTPETSYYSRYESLSDFLPKDKEEYNLKDVFNAVIAIRKHKLPQVEEVGTVGSFFVNPFVTKDHLKKLKKDFPGIQYYPVDKMQYPDLDSEVFENQDAFKIPAGWLIEELGWKGKFEGNVGTSPKHALCIITKGEATSADVVNFSKKIQKDIFEKTGIKLESEVNVV